MKRLLQEKRKSLLRALLFFCCIFALVVRVQATQTTQMTQEEESLVTTTVKKGSNLSVSVVKDNPDIKLSTVCGIDGFAVSERPVQIAVTVKSDKDFTGTLRVIPSLDEDLRKVGYAEEISLAKNESKTFCFTVASIGNMGKFDVQLLDSREKVIYGETDRMTLNNLGTNIMLGILSEDYSALNYFDGVPLAFQNYQNVVSTLELTKDNFPDNSEALSVLNYILIDNYDTANLSDKQYRALKEWVKSGGILLLSLGPNYQNVLHIFTDDFVSGTLGALSKREVRWGSLDVSTGGTWNEETGEWEEETASELSLKNVDCIAFNLAGGEPLSEGYFAADNNVYKKENGMGAVIVLSYSLGMEPVTSWSMRKDAASYLMMAAACEKTEELVSNNNAYSYYNSNRSGTEIAKTINGTRKPSAMLFGAVLFFYVIFVGPVLYLVLKKKAKREKLWLAIPCTAFIFTIVIFLLGSLYRVRRPMVDTFTVLELGNGMKKEKAYVNVTCPKAKKYSVLLNDSFSDIGYDQYNYHYGLFDATSREKDYDYLFCKKNGGTELVMDNDTAFDTTDFTAGRLTDNDMGNLELDIHCYTYGFDGTITNNTIYDLKGVMVTYGGDSGYYYAVGEIKRGETVTIDPQKVEVMPTYGFADTLYSQHGSLYKDREYYQQYKINDFMQNNYVRIGAYDSGYVWGKVDAYASELALDKTVKTSGMAVLMTEFSGEYEDVEGTYIQDINELMVSATGEFDSDSRNMWSGDNDVTYSFEQYGNITELTNLFYGQTETEDGYGRYADVYAYNTETGEYDLIFTDSDTLGGAELKKYLSGKVLILRYVMDESQFYSYYMPKIAARGDK